MEYSATSDLTIDVQDIKLIKRRWSKEDINSFLEGIAQNKSIEDLANDLNRSIQAICSKGNLLDYGYFTNKNDGLKYFKSTINHKDRRTKGEMMEGKEFVSVPESKDSEVNIDVAADIIPKIEINLIDLDIAIQILTMARSNAIAARTSPDSTGGDL